MKTRFVFLTVLLFTLSIQVSGQSLLGKRVLINYELAAFSPFDEDYTIGTKEEKGIPFYFQTDLSHQLQFELITNYRTTMGLSYHYLRTKTFGRTQDFNVSQNSLSLDFKFFNRKKGALAPFGRYFEFQIHRGIGKASDSDDSDNFRKYKNMTFKFVWGNRRVINQNLLYNMAFGISYSPYETFGFDEEGVSGEWWDVSTRLLYFHMFYIKVGINWNAF